MWVSDIKALHHIHNGYNFAKEPFRREIARSFSGQGVTWAHGEVPFNDWKKLGANRTPGETHKRQRRLIQPAFGVAETRALLPIFRGCIERVSTTSLLRVPGDVLSMQQVTTKWSDILAGAPESQEVLNVNDWLTRVALDAIGEGESELTVASCYLLSLVI